MNQEWIEGDLYFDFSKATRAVNFDNGGRGHGLQSILKSVDFIIEDDKNYYLMEIKNPENSKIKEEFKEALREEYLSKLLSIINIEKIGRNIVGNNSKLPSDLIKKFEDSLIFESLNTGVPNKKIIYLIFIGLSQLDSTQLSTLRDKIKTDELFRGPKIGDKSGWKKPLDVLFFNFESWNDSIFGEKFPVQKITTEKQ